MQCLQVPESPEVTTRVNYLKGINQRRPCRVNIMYIINVLKNIALLCMARYPFRERHCGHTYICAGTSSKWACELVYHITSLQGRDRTQGVIFHHTITSFLIFVINNQFQFAILVSYLHMFRYNVPEGFFILFIVGMELISVE